MLELFDEAQQNGQGVAVKNGKFVGPPMVAAAKKLLQKALFIKNSVKQI